MRNKQIRILEQNITFKSAGRSRHKQSENEMREAKA